MLLYKIIFIKPEKKGALGRPRHKLQENIQMDLKEMGGRVQTRFVWLRIGTRARLL
jgi:hypothetical protein